MTGKGGLTQAPNRRLRILLGVQLLWLGLVSALVFWWSRNILGQARRIAELESRLVGNAQFPLRAEEVTSRLERTEWMILGESWTFIIALVALTGGIVWFYWRDSLRTRSLQAFFASMTHELRTPLTSIRLQAESIADSLKEQASEAVLIRRLLEDTTRLEAQVERTLELARVEGGGNLYPQALQLRGNLQRILRSVSEAWGDRLRVEFDDGVSEDFIEADLAALQVIVRNIAENTVRHSGQVSPVLRVLQEATPAGARTLGVVFEDTGVSASAPSPGRGFGELFQKGPASQGAGVGLYLIRTLMERMGGNARFESSAKTPGFIVRLSFLRAGTHG